MDKEIFNFQGITSEQLKSLRNEIDAELKRRNDEKRLDLIDDVCKAVNALKKEFPDTRFEIQAEIECDYCDSIYDDCINVFGCFSKITPNMFDWIGKEKSNA